MAFSHGLKRILNHLAFKTLAFKNNNNSLTVPNLICYILAIKTVLKIYLKKNFNLFIYEIT